MKNAVVIGTIIPEPNSTAAGKRMLQLIEMLKSEYKITFLSTDNFSDYSCDLKSLGIDFKKILINDSSFEILIKNLNPDLVLFDRFLVEEQFGWKVTEACPNTLKVLDTEDLHFLRKAREIAYKQNRKLEQEDLISDIFKREMASILRCDLSLIISDFEMDLLINHFGISSSILHYIPIFAEANAEIKPFAERKNFVSIGNFLHEPNWQTVLRIKRIWKSIRKKLPDAEMHIYGAYTSDKAKQLHNEKDKFLIKGRADSVESVFEDVKVLLAPIPFGAGIKGKLLDSMRLGLPNVTTSIGAEGMAIEDLWNGFVEDEDEQIIDKAVLLYSDEKIWNDFQKKGFEIIKKRFLKSSFESQFLLKLNEIKNDLHYHRNKNFLGQVLQHHTLQSTKYMSKWIEEKNKSSV